MRWCLKLLTQPVLLLRRLGKCQDFAMVCGVARRPVFHDGISLVVHEQDQDRLLKPTRVYS